MRQWPGVVIETNNCKPKAVAWEEHDRVLTERRWGSGVDIVGTAQCEFGGLVLASAKSHGFLEIFIRRDTRLTRALNDYNWSISRLKNVFERPFQQHRRWLRYSCQVTFAFTGRRLLYPDIETIKVIRICPHRSFMNPLCLPVNTVSVIFLERAIGKMLARHKLTYVGTHQYEEDATCVECMQ